MSNNFEDISVNDKITMKKTHPCGGNIWTVLRIGADYKVCCDKCSHILLASKHNIQKWTKLVYLN